MANAPQTITAARRRPARVAWALALAVALLGPSPLMDQVWAQGWQWPWESAPKPPPVPPAPMNRPPPQAAPPPGEQPPATGWAQQSTPICLQLEQRLVQESQRGDQSRNVIPMVENEMRQVEGQVRAAQQQLERSDCWDIFLFSKTLRRTPRCVDLQGQVEGGRRRLADLEMQHSQLTSGRSFQDDIIRELARNNCGANYSQQARRRDDNPLSTLWSEEDSGGSGGLGNFNALPYATYRTVCVRLCDGYFFPVSFSTLPNHFERDAESCQSKCAAPAELYYYQNPGGSTEDMVGYRSNTRYTALKAAFRYRKEYVNGCSCKQAEFVPDGGPPQQTGSTTAPAGGAPMPPPATAAASAPAASGWSAEAEAGERLPWAPPR